MVTSLERGALALPLRGIVTIRNERYVCYKVVQQIVEKERVVDKSIEAYEWLVLPKDNKIECGKCLQEIDLRKSFNTALGLFNHDSAGRLKHLFHETCLTDCSKNPVDETVTPTLDVASLDSFIQELPVLNSNPKKNELMQKSILLLLGKNHGFDRLNDVVCLPILALAIHKKMIGLKELFELPESQLQLIAASPIESLQSKENLAAYLQCSPLQQTNLISNKSIVKELLNNGIPFDSLLDSRLDLSTIHSSTPFKRKEDLEAFLTASKVDQLHILDHSLLFECITLSDFLKLSSAKKALLYQHSEMIWRHYKGELTSLAAKDLPALEAALNPYKAKNVINKLKDLATSVIFRGYK